MVIRAATFALRATVGKLHLSAGEARWLATRRSLTLAGERRLEAPPGFEPGMEVLQTSALPLGDGALRGCCGMTRRIVYLAVDCARCPAACQSGATA